MPLPARYRIVNPVLKRSTRRAGFTLVEMAVALVIVALLLGSLLGPLSVQIEQRKISEAQKALDQINDALMGFAMSQTPPRLPCPDTTGDGIEDSPCGAGNNSTVAGSVPWVTLGVAARDSWGQRYQYRVNGGFTAAAGITLNTLTPAGGFVINGNGDLRVFATCSPGCATLVTNAVPAVVYSSGPNGATQPPTSPDELENTTVVGHVKNDRIFVSRTYSSVTGTEFDDIVTWISAPVLNSRLVAAQKLP